MATKTSYKVIISPLAKNDLHEIFSYISSVLYAGQAAQTLMAEIQEMILSIGENPHKFTISLDHILAEKGYRRAIVKKYVILYLADEDKKIVNIVRVFYGSMNYAKYI
ncbi:MAG: type II toxin-antitoxin system RelE/ParE family toxin [Clostridiales bacterium]|jgi:addiction module RelE/StbE family toxin|nr:type II toxin-antitoxin system RelE/ParE family toxin [Clostridiales bacterium]